MGFSARTGILAASVLTAAALLLGVAPPPEKGRAMVSTDHALASEAGAAVLREGGNAVDAAVAAALAAGVVQPAGSGLGGGGFAVIVEPVPGASYAARTLDFREVAPGAAHRDVYRAEDGGVVPKASTVGGLAIAVPSESRGLALLLERHGRLSPKQVAAPAIRLATTGWPVGPHLAAALARTKHPEVQSLFAVGGRVATEGDSLKNPALARTLRQWAATGGEYLHSGAGGRAIADEAREAGGVLTAEDLAGYQPVDRDPIVTSYRGYTLVTMGPPSSGGIVLGQMLRVLEGYDVAALGHSSSDHLHLLGEVMKHAYADRAQFMGDPAFTEIPVQRLLSDERVLEIRRAIWPAQTFPPEHYGEMFEPPKDAGTQHISVLDRDGRAVALTTTINTSFASGVVVEELGIILNNEMDDFAAAPGVPNAYGLVGNDANAIAPGKRPLSSMTPTVVLDAEGEVVLVVGGSGGSQIITGVLQVVSNVIDFDMDPQEAVAAARVHHQWVPNVLWVEPEIPLDVRGSLIARGHELRVHQLFSSIQAVTAEEDDLTLGGSDPRKGGWAAGVW